MMKFVSLIALLMFTTCVIAQEKPLSTDERGKLIYYEIVTLKDASADSLKSRAKAFFKKSGKFLKLKSSYGDTTIHAEGKLIINKTALVLSRPSGEVMYNFYAEVKNGKYRFWLTDFNFIPYQRDRYGNFVAATTVGTALEKKMGKLNAAEWAGYVKATTKEANALALRFKEAMIEKAIPQPTIKAAPVSPKQNW